MKELANMSKNTKILKFLRINPNSDNYRNWPLWAWGPQLKTKSFVDFFTRPQIYLHSWSIKYNWAAIFIDRRPIRASTFQKTTEEMIRNLNKGETL